MKKTLEYLEAALFNKKELTEYAKEYFVAPDKKKLTPKDILDKDNWGCSVQLTKRILKDLIKLSKEEVSKIMGKSLEFDKKKAKESAKKERSRGSKLSKPSTSSKRKDDDGLDYLSGSLLSDNDISSAHDDWSGGGGDFGGGGASGGW